MRGKMVGNLWCDTIFKYVLYNMRCGVNTAALLFQHKKRRHQRGNQKLYIKEEQTTQG